MANAANLAQKASFALLLSLICLHTDVAVGAPWSGDNGRGQVFIYLGKESGLSATPSQVIDSSLPSSRGAFGFALRGGVDIDGNGYPGVFGVLIRCVDPSVISNQ